MVQNMERKAKWSLGRPKGSANKRGDGIARLAVQTFRVSQEERQAIRAAADSLGVDAGEMIRDALRTVGVLRSSSVKHARGRTSRPEKTGRAPELQLEAFRELCSWARVAVVRGAEQAKPMPRWARGLQQALRALGAD